jgi:hypothetical protein
MRALVRLRVFIDAAINDLRINNFYDFDELPRPRMVKNNDRYWVTYGGRDDVQLLDLLSHLLAVSDQLDGYNAPAADAVRKDVGRLRTERQALDMPLYAR